MTLESAVMQSCVASVTKYETIETHAGTFLTLNILAIGRVSRDTYNLGRWLIL